MKKKVVFTDLDGTLLDNQYRFKPALSALKSLKEQRIPLVICTSKTRAEVEVYRKKLGNKHPFISENGGGIFIPKKYFKKKFKYNKGTNDYYIIELGKHYEKLIKVLEKINEKIPVKGFSNMNVVELFKNSGLDFKQARLAKKREYDEAFILKDKKQEKKLFGLIKKYKLNYTKGGRYYHLLGNNDKGKAVRVLSGIYKNEYGGIKTVSLGDAKNDVAMFKSTDESFLIKGPYEWNKKIIGFLGLDKKEIKRGEELYKKSIEILKKLHLGNGAILASFPKSRYPYVYPRDHSIVMIAFIEADLFDRAKKSLEFILECQNSNGSFPQRLNRKGKDASYKPIQLDNTALVVYAFCKYIKRTNNLNFLNKNKGKIKKSINYMKSQIDKDRNLFFSPNSIHEFPPLEEGLEVWVNSVCFAALSESQDIGISTGINLKRLKSSIEKHFWNGKHFVKTIRLKESSSVVIDIDSSAYALGDFGVFEDDSEKIKKTVGQIEKELWHRKLGGICRYKKHTGRNNGGWGPWPHFTLMLARHFIRVGNKKKADEYLNWVFKIAYKNKLPEHIATKKDFEDWVMNYKSAGILRKDREIMIKNIRKNERFKKGLAYSVLPLAWPHAEFIRTWKLYKDRFL